MEPDVRERFEGFLGVCLCLRSFGLRAAEKALHVRLGGVSCLALFRIYVRLLGDGWAEDKKA